MSILISHPGRIVVSLDGEAREIVVDAHAAQEIVLDFPMHGVTARLEAADLVLTCPNGFTVLIAGLPQTGWIPILLADGTLLDTQDAFLAHFFFLSNPDALITGHGGAPAEEGPISAEAEPATPQPVVQAAMQPVMQPAEQPVQATEPAPELAPEPVLTPIPASGLEEFNGLLTYLARVLKDLVPGVDRYGALHTYFWGRSPSLHGKEPEPGSQPETETITSGISVASIPGADYPRSDVVLESDPYGIMLEFTLSRPSSGASAMSLNLSKGTAVMSCAGKADGDILHWSEWSVLLPDGKVLCGEDCIREAVDGKLLITLPPHVASFQLQIPIVNDELYNPDCSFCYELCEAGEYKPQGDCTGTILIVDNSRIQELQPDWTPPEPGKLPPDYVGPRGSLARVVIYDGNDSLASATVPEHGGAPVLFRFELRDLESGDYYTPCEAIEISLQLTGNNGLSFASGPDQDVAFAQLLAKFRAVDPNAVFDEAGGRLSFTLPKGWSDGYIEFAGTVTADDRIEAGRDGSPESLEIAVIAAKGNGTVIGSGSRLEIIDTPVASVSVSSEDFFESADHPSLPNCVDFTFSLSSTLPGQGLTIRLDWDQGGATTLETHDYTWALNGVTQSGPLPATLSFPAGIDTAVISISAIDDKLSEAAKDISVSIRPENGAGLDTDCYRVSKAQASASSTLHDDTAPARGGSAHLDGPVVRFMACDDSGKIIDTERCDIPEEQGTAYFRPVLYNQDGSLLGSPPEEDITVIFTIRPSKGAQLALGDTASPGDDFLLNFPNAHYKVSPKTDSSGETYYELSLTIAAEKYANAAEYVFKGLGVPDPNPNETGEGFRISVLESGGHEALPGADLDVLFLDAPVLSVTAAQADYPENGGPAQFTISASPMPRSDTEVWLKLEGAGGNKEDLDLSAPNGFELVEAGGDIYLKVTIPANTPSVTILLPIKDDALSPDMDGDNREAGSETLSLSLVAQGGPAPAPYPAYAINPAQARALSAINDDSATHPDGPLVAIVLLDASGKIITDNSGAPVRQASALEHTGQEVRYMAALFERDEDGNVALNPDGSWKQFTAEQNITVSIGVTGHNGTDFTSGGATDFSFEGKVFTPDPGDASRGTISLVVPRGFPGVSFSGKAVPDIIAREGTEYFDLAIRQVSGNEAVISQDLCSVSTTIVDAPLASIAFGEQSEVSPRDHFSESESSFSFTVSLSSPALSVTRVFLDWSASDADLVMNGFPPYVDIPAGETCLTTHIALKDNALTAGDKQFQVHLKHESGDANSAGQSYHVDPAKDRAAGTIVDDTRDWDLAWGAEPLAHSSLEGPRVILILKDADANVISDAQAHRIKENGGEVQYELKIVDASDPARAYAGVREDITVTLKVGGTADSGTDLLFYELSGGMGQIPVNSGSMSILIPADRDSVAFKATAQADTSVEAKLEGNGYVQEDILVAIDSVSGNEASCEHTAKAVTIIDAPTVSISASATHYSESPPDGQTHNEMEFTISLSSPVLEDIKIYLDWGGPANDPAILDADYILPREYPGYVLIEKGEAGATLRVPIIDDDSTEKDEKLTVSIRPENDADKVDNNYHVSTSAGHVEVTIVDDSRPWPSNGGQCPPQHKAGTEDARLEGPVVRIMACDEHGKVIDAARHDILEKQGNMHFRPVLYDRDGSPLGSPPEEDIRVSFTIRPTGGAQLALGDTASPGDDFLFNFPNSHYSVTPKTDPSGQACYEVTLTITASDYANAAEYVFAGLAVPDSNPDEAGEGFRISVLETVGHEALPGADLGVTLLDMPVISIAAAQAEFAENDGPMEFTISVNPMVDSDTVIWLKLGGAGGNKDDLDLSGPSGFDLVEDGKDIYIKVTVPANTPSVTIALPIKDDALSPGVDGDNREASSETVSLTIVPQGGPAPEPRPDYAINP
ncbi:hypothetical protein LJC59_05580, partial [Desulfovibrio sp. OttesenSCG-928-A18]|nr:hypothetical protein [Desulfovibrio sp. OttesenSCG-928-A18]